jgi:hypothetical protein
MTRIVTSHYRYRRPPRKRKAVALEVPAIVKAADPAKVRKRGRVSIRIDTSDAAKPEPPANDDRPDPAPLPTDGQKSSIVTIRRRGKRFADVPDMTPEEHKRRGDGAAAMFQEMKRQIAREARRNRP